MAQGNLYAYATAMAKHYGDYHDRKHALRWAVIAFYLMVSFGLMKSTLPVDVLSRTVSCVLYFGFSLLLIRLVMTSSAAIDRARRYCAGALHIMSMLVDQDEDAVLEGHGKKQIVHSIDAFKTSRKMNHCDADQALHSVLIYYSTIYLEKGKIGKDFNLSVYSVLLISMGLTCMELLGAFSVS